MAEYKQVNLQIGTEAQFESKKETLPVGTFVGITDPIHKSELDNDLQTSIDSIANKLNMPSDNFTETSVVTLTSTGTVDTKKLSEFATTTYMPVTIPWTNLAPSRGIQDQIRMVSTVGTELLYEHSLYIRAVYNNWHAEVFVTLLVNTHREITEAGQIIAILGDLFYHEASGIITTPVDDNKYSVGHIQNISHNGVKVLLPK